MVFESAEMNWVQLAVICLPQGNVDVLVHEVSEFNTAVVKIGRTSKSRVSLLDVRCCNTIKIFINCNWVVTR